MMNISKLIKIDAIDTDDYEEAIQSTIYEYNSDGYKVVSTIPINYEGSTTSILIIFEEIEDLFQDSEESLGLSKAR